MATDVATSLPAGVLLGWLREQRWFAAKDREPHSLTVVSSAEFASVSDGSEPGGSIVLVDVEFGDGEAQRYQLVIGVRRNLPGNLTHAAIAAAGERWYYEGLADPRLCAALLAAIARGTALGPIEFTAEARLDVAAMPARIMGIEQSNTSVVFGDRFILKVFRRIWPGTNPELTLHRMLRGNDHVAGLLGSVHWHNPDGRATLAVLQEFAAGATDGWTLATASLDRLPAKEMAPLGAAVAAVHGSLASALGSAPMGADQLADRLITGLARAVAAVPELAPFSGAVHRIATGIRAEQFVSQRVHGDLHLGQVLRTPERWLLIDFEGEPARPIAERGIPDSPLRDVAGILRSLDYVAGFHALNGADQTGTWVSRNRDAFLDGYAHAAGVDPREHGHLLQAYQLDKALYEVAYEAQHRPQWIRIPLRAIAELLHAGQDRACEVLA